MRFFGTTKRARVPAVSIGVPRESGVRERRVALTPSEVGELTLTGYEVVVEASAGLAANMLLARVATRKAKPNGCYILVFIRIFFC